MPTATLTKLRNSTRPAERGKPLTSTDMCGEEFQQKILGGRPGTSVNIDTVFHTDTGWHVIELLQDARPDGQNDPWTSHPNRYWKNWRKFTALWALTQKLDGTLWLINYSRHSERVKVMQVTGVAPGPEGGITELAWDTTFEQFQAFYLQRFVNATIPSW